MFAPIMDWLNDKEEEWLGGTSHNARFMRGTFWLGASTVVSLVLGMVSSIAVARMLNKTAFGEFGMVINTIAMFGAFTGLGLGLTSAKYISEFKIKDPRRANRIMKLTNFMAFLSGGIFSSLIFIFAEQISTKILNAPFLVNNLRLGCVLLFLNTLAMTQSAALHGFESFKMVTKVNTLRGLIYAPVVIGGTYFFGLSGAVAGVVISGSAGWALNHMALKSECKKFNLPSDSGNIFSEFSILWRFSLPALIGGAIVGPIIWLANTILVHTPGGYGELGLVNAATQWKNLITTLPAIFCSAALPILSSEQDSRSDSSKILDMTQKVTIFIILPTYVFTLFLGDFIMSLYGKSFSGGYPVLVGITLAICLSAICNVASTSLAAAGKMWRVFIFNIAWGTVLIAFIYLFAARWGARAYAAGYVLSYFFLFVLFFWFIKKVLNNNTLIFTVLSVIYLFGVTFMALSLKPDTRLFLSAPLILLSIGLGILVLGKDITARILFKFKASKNNNINKVSIILPTHNGEKYLAESIESCLEQTYSNFELIIIDDASTDNTPSIIKEYANKDSRIIPLRNEINLKLPASLNKGFAVSTGDYLTWTSDDNRFAPNAIKHLTEYLNKHKSVDFVYSNFYFIDENGNILNKFNAFKPQFIFNKNCIGACFMYRRKVYAAIGDYSADAFLVEDYEYWLRIHQQFNMHKLEEYLYFYRSHKNSLSAKFSEENVTALMEKTRDRFVRSKAHKYCLYADKYLRLHNYTEARKYFIKSFIENPFNLNLLRIGIVLLLDRGLTDKVRLLKYFFLRHIKK